MSRTFDARQQRFGGVLEDYEVGDLFVHWPGKTVTAAEDHFFCMVTMAASPLHIDAHYAATEMPGGRNVVVGTFVYALLLGMSVRDISGQALASLGVRELRHTAPLYHDDTLYGRSLVVALRPSASKPEAGILTVQTEGHNQNETLVCAFERTVLLPRLSHDRKT